MIRALLLTLLALAIGGVALYWMWTRVHADASLSAEDYIERSKAQARASLRPYLKSRGPRDS